MKTVQALVDQALSISPQQGSIALQGAQVIAQCATAVALSQIAEALRLLAARGRS